jgi:hypothetical protein
MVETPTSQFIDHGTEFGVLADADGSSELHVIKGKVQLFASSKGSTRIGQMVSEDKAVKFNVNSNQIKVIPVKRETFARQIDVKTGVVWREQPKLDLADIAGKGNGLGTGESSVIINPVKGYTKDSNLDFLTSREFLPISDNPFVDGVFIPNGDIDQVINTQGDVFQDAPKTSGLYSMDMVANPRVDFYKTGLRKGTIEFNGQPCGKGGKPCIVMHANIGLTFDLETIRKSYYRGIDRFTARIGIADLDEPYPCNADFYVLIDGQIRYSLLQYKQKGVLNDISVEIKKTDRFLTLITADGGDPDNPAGGFYNRAISCDWCVFTDPVLVLE